jgi:GNAT superfamily N-acetyltransferase
LVEVSDKQLAEIVEFGEAGAHADWWRAVPGDIARQFGIRIERVGLATAMMLGAADNPLLNRVMGLGLAEPATETMIDDIADLYKEAGTGFMVQISPVARPAELPEWLEERGIKRRDNWAKVYRGTEPPPEVKTDLSIEVGRPEYVSAWNHIGCTAFEVPPEFSPVTAVIYGRPVWINYLAFDGDEPVAAGALFVNGDIGWLGYGSTLPSHRRRGAQGAIMARRIKDAIEMGCKWIITETGEDTPEHPNPSYHNMVRTGFRLAYMRPNYVKSAKIAE